MAIFLSFTVIGLVAGCVYALIATGLVVTYNTTGIFNFAHGAIAMVGAYAFWQFWQGWGWPAPLALVMVVLVLAPLFGLFIERLLMRPLRGAPVDLTLVVTLGLLLFLVGLAQIIWDPSEVRNLPSFFNGDGKRIGYVLVTYHEVVAVAATVAIAIALRLLFNTTRTGIAMRAVVDNADLLAMAGGRPIRIQQLSWMLSSSIAALAGILLAPIARLDILLLTLLVVDGYAAAIIGRLRNLPLAVAGAMAIGLGQFYISGYANADWVKRVQYVIPMVVLFAVLILLPQDRLRTASFTGAVAPRVAGLKASLVWGLVLVAGTMLVSTGLSGPNLRTAANGFALALVLLSLLLLTGYGGMVSICQLTFVGLGSIAMGKVGGDGGSLLGVLAAIGLAAGAGFLLALPTLKMRGLYLALATFAFAAVFDQAVFTQIFGTGGNQTVARPNIPGIPTGSDQAFLVLCSVVFAAAAIGVLAFRRGSLGRRLVAVNDSPAACATLGVNVNRTKLVVFTASAAMCGLAGVLYGGVTKQVDANSFAALLSLVALLLARIGGINTATGVLLGAFTFALFPTFLPHLPDFLSNQFLLTGIAAVSVGRDPNGLGGRIAQGAEKLRELLGLDRKLVSVPVSSDDGTAAAVFLEEEGRLVSAGH
ncbi:MAG: branched-chain amino acid transport system permease protein livM [Frankiaceae bacterium]|jgi:branched-chain amino acid transport system permease protein|nr:branched-chain amino acid transport system permease protein livM [Frankiaceae bacterium]